jgi:hypothetical protein
MVSDVHVQDGGQISKKHNFGIFQYLCVLIFALSLYFCQQHKKDKFIENSGSLQISKMAGQNLIF